MTDPTERRDTPNLRAYNTYFEQLGKLNEYVTNGMITKETADAIRALVSIPGLPTPEESEAQEAYRGLRRPNEHSEKVFDMEHVSQVLSQKSMLKAVISGKSTGMNKLAAYADVLTWLSDIIGTGTPSDARDSAIMNVVRALTEFVNRENYEGDDGTYERQHSTFVRQVALLAEAVWETEWDGAKYDPDKLSKLGTTMLFVARQPKKMTNKRFIANLAVGIIASDAGWYELDPQPKAELKLREEVFAVLSALRPISSNFIRRPSKVGS